MTRRCDARGRAPAQPRRAGLALALALLSAAVALLLGGCDVDLSSLTAVPATPTRAAPTAEPTANPTPLPSSSPQAPTLISLTVWTTEAFSPTTAITSGLILAQEVAAFEADHPDLQQVNFVLKKPYGKGGMLDYLLTTSAAVPDLLPDLAFLDVDDLPHLRGGPREGGGRRRPCRAGWCSRWTACCPRNWPPICMALPATGPRSRAA